MDYLLFFSGVLYMMAAVYVGMRVNDKCRQCLCRATGDSEFLFYLMLLIWPLSIPLLVLLFGRPLKESDVMHKDW
ncbi:MAG: hypothetical protein OEX07_03300 [Gammaproteobacteria bacterium]|nr:hypothetical protein [Gammaproteobacteria bacterium]